MANTSATVNLLNVWGFSEKIIQQFTVQEIEKDQFNDLTEEDLKLLIPNIGPRRKFQNNLKKYLEITQKTKKKVDSNNKPQASQQDLNFEISLKRQKLEQQHASSVRENNEDNNSTNVTENISVTSPSTSTAYEVINNATSTTGKEHAYNKNNNRYDLESILKKSIEGQMLLHLYKNKKELNNNLRNKLAKIIVNNELSSNINNIIRSKRAAFLSDQIIKLFPTENKNVWYINHKKGRMQSKGKILTKYYNTRQKLAKAGLLCDKIAHVTDNEVENDDTNDVTNYEEYIFWLKNNCKPWQTIIEYWLLTSKKRLRALQTSNNQTCYEYMAQFPALSDPLGYLLLEKDFETLYPGRTLKLYTAWENISNFVNSKVTPKLKNCFNVSTPDGAKIVTLLLMPHLFPVNTVKNDKGQSWRPSKKESEKAFLLHVNTIADLETRLQERTTKLQSFGQPSQPIAVIIGPSLDEIVQCFVIIDPFRYEVGTPLKAIDFVFKLCNVLNIQYPFEVGQLFMFLQRAVYNFETIWDTQKDSQLTSSVFATIQEYKNKY